MEIPALIGSLLSPRTVHDPYTVYRVLRENAPLHYFRPLNAFLVTRYVDCLALQRDRGLRVMDRARQGERRLGRWSEQVLSSIEHWPIYRNPPEHAVARQAAVRGVAPAKDSTFQAFVEQHCERLLDQVAEQGRGGSVVNLQSVFNELPMIVMTRLLGLPSRDVSRLVALMAQFSLLFELLLTGGQNRRLDQSHDRLVAYFLELIDQGHRGEDDLFAALVAAWKNMDGGKTDRQVAGMLCGLLLAGYETTAGLLGNGAHAFAANPAQAELLAAHPELADRAVDEVLRWDSPVQVNTRVAGNDLFVGDRTIAAGTVVCLVYGSAHHDPQQYPDPERFDITRTPGRPFSFGLGIHHCVGSTLARVEAAAMFCRLVRRFPLLRLAGQPVRRRPGFTIRTFETLPVWVA